MTEKWLNLSIERDGPYSKLIVLASALLSFSTFGFNISLTLITADWKLDKNLPFETAATHSTLVMAFRLIMTIVTSALLPKMYVKNWTLLSLILLTLSMGLAFTGRYVTSPDDFYNLQVIVGVLNGSGVGIAYALMIIVPQAWLDKTRTQYNGLLLIGAPIGNVITSFMWPRLVDCFTWSGALLIIIGLQLQSIISWRIFETHPDSPIKESSFKTTLENWRTLTRVQGVMPFLFFNIIYIGFVMTPVLAMLINICTEYDVTRAESGYLFMMIALADGTGRLVWGVLGQYFDTSAMMIGWSALTVATMTCLALSRTFIQFIMCCFGIGISFSGFGSHKQAFLVELVGLKLQPDYIIVDNLCSVPVLLLVGIYGPKLGSDVFDIENPSFFLWVSVSFCFTNLLLAIHLHRIVRTGRRSLMKAREFVER